MDQKKELPVQQPDLIHYINNIVASLTGGYKSVIKSLKSTCYCFICQTKL